MYLGMTDCHGTSSGTRVTSGQPFGSCTCLFHPYVHLCQGMECSQLGEILDTCIWSRRTLGFLFNRYGVATTLYGAINHWNLEEAWEIGGTERQAVLYTPSLASCVLTFIKTENKAVIQNVTGFCSHAEAHSFNAVSLEIFCRACFERRSTACGQPIGPDDQWGKCMELAGIL